MEDAGRPTVRPCQSGQKHRGRPVEAHLHRMRVERRHGKHARDASRAKHVQTAPVGLRLQVPLERPDNLGRCQGRAVVEYHLGAQGKGIYAPIRGNSPPARQHRPHGAVLARSDQAFDDMENHTVGVLIPAGARVGGDNVRVQAGAYFQHQRSEAARRVARKGTQASRSLLRTGPERTVCARICRFETRGWLGFRGNRPRGSMVPSAMFFQY